MTDNEIVKALELCSSYSNNCKRCPARGKKTQCTNDIKRKAAAIIKRLQAENARLAKECLAVCDELERQRLENKENKKDAKIVVHLEWDEKLIKEMINKATLAVAGKENTDE